MTQDFITDTRRRLSSYMASSKRPQAGVAREIGISGAALSRFLSDSYTGDNGAIAQKVESFLKLDKARKNLIDSPPICLAVENTERILTAVNMANEARHMLLIYGPAGCSKSFTLKHFCEHSDGAIYVELDATIGNQRNAIMEIAKVLGVSSPGKSTAQMMRDILTALRGTNRILIIDECQHLNERSFDALRAINDKAGVGMVFSGNKNVLKRMFGRMEPEYDQLFSRFGEIVELRNHYSAKEIAGIYSGFDVDKECTEYLRRVACQKGGLRRMDKQFKMAAIIADTLRQPLSLPFLHESEKRLTVAGRVL
jgi:DNA transposition AAA+ family ATPase